MNQNKQLDLCLKKKDPDPITNQKQKIYIHYYLAKNITLNHVEENIEDLFNIEQVLTKNNTLVLIIKDDINETLTNELKHIWEKDGIFIIAIPIKRLQFNILNHQLQPKIRVMEPQEVLDIQKKFNIKNLAEFPKISRFDPLAQAICIRPNQVCEIIRSSKTSITSLYYRVCVNV
jgi:DNA-directed RNA polymerase subunit H (RpoH/RPB5)